MEILYYKSAYLLRTSQASAASEIPSKLQTNTYICDNADTPHTPTTPYAPIYQLSGDPLDPNKLETNDWIVKRSVSMSVINSADPTNPYVLEGTLTGSTKLAKISYVVARIQIDPGPTNPLYGQTSVKIARRMIYSTASIFQYSVFSQGDLELAPGGNTVIEGDISANGSIYMGASGGGTLTVEGYVHYLSGDYFNQTPPDETTGIQLATYRKPGTLMPNGSVVTADTNTLSAPIFTTSQSTQVLTMDSPENLLSGLDAVGIAKANPELFGPNGSPDSTTWTDAQLTQATNNVYRSLIAPPPAAVAQALGSSDTNSAEYPASTTLTTSYADNPSISAVRAYNRAGLVITVGTNGSISSITGVNPQNGATVDLTSVLSGSVVTTTKTTTNAQGNTITTPISLFDQRESKTVAITQIDIGALGQALQSQGAVPTAAPSYSFNGLVYVHLANSSASNPAAVRLINATTTPGVDTNAHTASGFSLATNGGLYVKGDYNTTTDDSLPITTGSNVNPSMLMADSVTVLSSAWDDANSTSNGNVANSTSAIGYRVASSGTTTINAGILTGNVAAVVSNTAPTASGGGQNLVRFLEDWRGNSVKFYGSLGRLFNSNYFTGVYQQPGNVYQVPGLRTFAFNSTMKTAKVPGQPLITNFNRGDFFTW